MKSADLIGHIKFLAWGQLDGCSVTTPFPSLQRVWLARVINTLTDQWLSYHMTLSWKAAAEKGFYMEIKSLTLQSICKGWQLGLGGEMGKGSMGVVMEVVLL